MGNRLEAEGKTGVIGSAIYSGWGHMGFHWITPFHNIAGMLTESASARLATPMFLHPDQLRGGPRNLPAYESQINMPSLWPGGWWRVRDIVEQQKIAAWATVTWPRETARPCCGTCTSKAPARPSAAPREPSRHTSSPRRSTIRSRSGSSSTRSSIRASRFIRSRRSSSPTAAPTVREPSSCRWHSPRSASSGGCWVGPSTRTTAIRAIARAIPFARMTWPPTRSASLWA